MKTGFEAISVRQQSYNLHSVQPLKSPTLTIVKELSHDYLVLKALACSSAFYTYLLAFLCIYIHTHS